jgi:hypothetical protein
MSRKRDKQINQTAYTKGFLAGKRDSVKTMLKLEALKEVYIDEHKRWAITCGDSSCCACMDLLSVLDALNDVLEMHGEPVTYQGVPIEWCGYGPEDWK